MQAQLTITEAADFNLYPRRTNLFVIVISQSSVQLHLIQDGNVVYRSVMRNLLRIYTFS